MDNYDERDLQALDFEDDVEFEELEEEALDAQMALLAARVRAARFAGA